MNIEYIIKNFLIAKYELGFEIISGVKNMLAIANIRRENVVNINRIIFDLNLFFLISS